MINTFVALDIETTGLNPAEDKIIEIGMAKISDGEIVDSYSTLVNPGIKISCKLCRKKMAWASFTASATSDTCR